MKFTLDFRSEAFFLGFMNYYVTKEELAGRPQTPENKRLKSAERSRTPEQKRLTSTEKGLNLKSRGGLFEFHDGGYVLNPIVLGLIQAIAFTGMKSISYA